MVSPNTSNAELYNLRWNSYFSNLINVFTEHQHQEALVDVTLSCEGQFIKAHKLILSACSIYFQKLFETHSATPLVIVLNDVKFKDLQLVVQFMYKGEVKVADADMPQFLSLGKLLHVKGLCSVDLQEKNQIQSNGDAKTTTKKVISNETKKVTCKKIVCVEPPTSDDKQPPAPKKRKLTPPPPPPPPAETKKKNVKPQTSGENQHVIHIPRPPNAFMIFANQWRKKLAVEYLNESNKEISVRLGNMWKSLSQETKDAFYEDARKADEEHKLKYPGYSYNPTEARQRKAIATQKAAQKSTNEDSDEELLEIKFEEDYCEDGGNSSRQNS